MSLGELSFREHKALAEAEGGRERWGHAKLTSVSYQPSKRSSSNRGRLWDDGEEDLQREGSSVGDAATEVPPWLKRKRGYSVDVIDDESATAIAV